MKASIKAINEQTDIKQNDKRLHHLTGLSKVYNGNGSSGDIGKVIWFVEGSKLIGSDAAPTTRAFSDRTTDNEMS